MIDKLANLPPTIPSIDVQANFKLTSTPGSDDTAIIRYVHAVISEAIAKNASDIHLEPYEKYYRIRFRIDGILYETATPPQQFINRITTRIKIMAQLDISEKRIPQDGRFKIVLSQASDIDFRVSTCPTIHGEKIVIRLLNTNNALLKLDALGLELEQKGKVLTMLNKPQGMLLVTGPTGSGKTVTLYTALNTLNHPEINICTVEDPVEIQLPNINQIAINPKAGLTFANALRAFLRQDPDVIMVGEMRDLETAEIGIKAAQTGHLVLSTLHTNSAAESLTRLSNIGIPLYNIATSVSLIIAQRLARCLCTHCKREEKIPSSILLQEGFSATELETLIHYAPVGCNYCTQGYKGRTGLFEILPITPSIREMIMQGSNSLDIATQARTEGMVTLRESGLDKVRQGIVSLTEINRIINKN
jgi:type IV pilus assembly protein PilB